MRTSVHDQVKIFNQITLNIFHKFITKKTIFYDDRHPPWMNEKIKSMIKKEDVFYRRHRKSIDFDCTTLDVVTQKQTKIFAISTIGVSKNY